MMLPSRVEQWHLAILDLLNEANLCQPDQLPQLVNAVTEQLAAQATIFLVDHEQEAMRELAADVTTGEQLPVEGSLAGLAFQSGTIQVEPKIRWIPILDSTERLGVLRLADETSPDDAVIQFANLLGHLITAKLPYGDRLHDVRCSQPMTVASVLLRQLLPPSTCTTDRLVIAASLQPAYTIGGDAFDYAIDGDVAYLGIFDGVGHGLGSGLSAAVALSATRAARRNAQSLESIAADADLHLSEQFDDASFVTAVLVRLDVRTGALRYLSAGHPAPIVLRLNGGTIVLEEGRRLPLGMMPETSYSAADYRLEPGDRLLLYTDGVLEARGQSGEFLGPDRLIDLARRLTLANESTPEIARKINASVVSYHGSLPDDDSTVLILEWSSTAAERTLP